jgi:AraC-like DNA-binding protein
MLSEGNLSLSTADCSHSGPRMRQTHKRYLDRHRVMRTHDLEAARAFLHSKGFCLDVARRDASALDVCINCAILPNVSIGYLQMGIPAVTRSVADLTDYQILLPLRDAMEVHVAGARLACGPRQAVVSSPRQAFRSMTSGAGERLRLCISEQAIRRHISALLGEAPPTPLQFVTAMDASTGFGNRFARQVLAATEDFEHANSIGASPATALSFEQLIVCELLLNQPHNHSVLLVRREYRVATRDVKRALEYMHAHLDRALSIEDIVATVGVAGRTLFKHFRDSYGISPMRYVRNLRFEKTRYALLNAADGTSITDVATSCGFSHLGRFAVEYRLRFGETPSQTLRKRSPNVKADHADAKRR